MTTSIKTSKEIATSLSGSAFRRVSFDGRTRMLRSIPTWNDRSCEKSPFQLGRTRTSGSR